VFKKELRPSPALVIAVLALFFALGGAAGAAVTAAVPLAKRALTADNAKKLNGFSATQIATAGARAGAEIPGPASTASSLVNVKTSTTSIAAGAEGEFTIACDGGQRVAGGGFASDGGVFNLDSHPSNPSTWRLYLVNGSDTEGAAVTLFATCIR
jgi:hypothetical protein